jgi:hypothetical protein
MFERLFSEDILKPLKIISLVKLMYSCQPGDASLISTASSVLEMSTCTRFPPLMISFLNESCKALFGGKALLKNDQIVKQKKK